jgi:hypothetical protein
MVWGTMGLFSKAGRSISDLVAWDERTCAHFAELERFDVWITSVTKRFGFGTKSDSSISEAIGYEASGVIRYPKYIQVALQILNQEGTEFGVWFYNVYNESDNLQRPVRGIPCIEIWVHDPQQNIGEALYESHKAAIASGRRKSEARFWKRRGDGFVTAKDKEAGWSTESYPLFGMYSWSLYESSNLPPWALPHR